MTAGIIDMPLLTWQIVNSVPREKMTILSDSEGVSDNEIPHLFGTASLIVVDRVVKSGRGTTAIRTERTPSVLKQRL